MIPPGTNIPSDFEVDVTDPVLYAACGVSLPQMCPSQITSGGPNGTDPTTSTTATSATTAGADLGGGLGGCNPPKALETLREQCAGVKRAVRL